MVKNVMYCLRARRLVIVAKQAKHTQTKPIPTICAISTLSHTKKILGFHPYQGREVKMFAVLVWVFS